MSVGRSWSILERERSVGFVGDSGWSGAMDGDAVKCVVTGTCMSDLREGGDGVGVEREGESRVGWKS
jgi:hypothetical protein